MYPGRIDKAAFIILGAAGLGCGEEGRGLRRRLTITNLGVTIGNIYSCLETLLDAGEAWEGGGGVVEVGGHRETLAY